MRAFVYMAGDVHGLLVYSVHGRDMYMREHIRYFMYMGEFYYFAYYSQIINKIHFYLIKGEYYMGIHILTMLNYHKRYINNIF